MILFDLSEICNELIIVMRLGVEAETDGCSFL